MRAIAMPERHAGFTLVESIITIAVLAIALVSVAYMLQRGLAESADTIVETRLVALGQAYLDEIVGRRFDEKSAPGGGSPCFGLPPAPTACTAAASFGPDGGESSGGVLIRARADDVDDYHGLVEGGGEAPPLDVLRDAEGNERQGYGNFHVEVEVRYAGDDAVIGKTATDAKLITVSVRLASQEDEEAVKFSVYRANY